MKIIYAIDFGAGDALAIYGPNGIVSKELLKLPRSKKGKKSVAQKFIEICTLLFEGSEGLPPGDIVLENATIGSSGCEVKDMEALIERCPHRKLYTVTTRVVKNYRADHKLGWRKGGRYAKDGGPAPLPIDLEKQTKVHEEDAYIIYIIATEEPHHLRHWTGPSERCPRIHTSVRPMDKREYRDERADEFMTLLPPYDALPEELRHKVGDKKKRPDYRRALVMPFAMATTEPYLDEGPIEKRKRRFEKIIGLYERGYPSFYRRATIVWMQEVAKELADVTKIGEVSPELRKEAWKITQRQIRWFYHLAMAHQGR